MRHTCIHTHMHRKYCIQQKTRYQIRCNRNVYVCLCMCVRLSCNFNFVLWNSEQIMCRWQSWVSIELACVRTAINIEHENDHSSSMVWTLKVRINSTMKMRLRMNFANSQNKYILSFVGWIVSNKKIPVPAVFTTLTFCSALSCSKWQNNFAQRADCGESERPFNGNSIPHCNTSFFILCTLRSCRWGERENKQEYISF